MLGAVESSKVAPWAARAVRHGERVHLTVVHGDATLTVPLSCDDAQDLRSDLTRALQGEAPQTSGPASLNLLTRRQPAWVRGGK